MKGFKHHGEASGHGGKRGTPTWVSWHNMIQRCCDPKAPNYPRYGGTGVTVCERWRNSFINFKADMGERPEGKTLDRWPNRNGNYEPGNCRWATPKEQSANRYNSRGVATHCKNGHEQTPENSYTYPGSGRTVCRPCKLQWWRNWNDSAVAEGRRA